MAPNFERKIFEGPFDPGSKHDIAIPADVPAEAKVQIFSDGFLIEVRKIQ
jgi:hypothetical protein